MENVEFFVGSDGNVWIRQSNSCRIFTANDSDIIDLVINKITKQYPSAYKRISEIFSNFNFNKWIFKYKIVERFIRCNMGADSIAKYDIEDGFLNLEEVVCPLHGICRDENIICKPKIQTALRKAELKAVSLYIKGYSVDEIAKKLAKNRSTVNNQIWQATQRLGLEKRRQLKQLAFLDYKTM